MAVLTLNELTKVGKDGQLSSQRMRTSDHLQVLSRPPSAKETKCPYKVIGPKCRRRRQVQKSVECQRLRTHTLVMVAQCGQFYTSRLEVVVSTGVKHEEHEAETHQCCLSHLHNSQSICTETLDGDGDMDESNSKL